MSEPSSPTPRMRAVLALPLTAEVLEQLLKERPSGACLVCWRDLDTRFRAAGLVCSRRVGKSPACENYYQRLKRAVDREEDRRALVAVGTCTCGARLVAL